MMRLLGLATGLATGLELLLGGTTLAAPETGMEHHGAAPTQAFERIEQPLALHLGVTAAGAGLIGLELWWFLVSKPKAKQVPMPPGNLD